MLTFSQATFGTIDCVLGLGLELFSSEKIEEQFLQTEANS